MARETLSLFANTQGLQFEYKAKSVLSKTHLAAMTPAQQSAQTFLLQLVEVGAIFNWANFSNQASHVMAQVQRRT